MPERETIQRAQEDAREGKSPSMQAGKLVREEIHHIREGKHGASSPQQAIAIGLSKARGAGVKLSPPKGPSSLRKKAAQDSAAADSSPHIAAARFLSGNYPRFRNKLDHLRRHCELVQHTVREASFAGRTRFLFCRTAG